MLAYNNELVLVAESYSRKIIICFALVCRWGSGLKMNAEKSKVMVFGESGTAYDDAIRVSCLEHFVQIS